VAGVEEKVAANDLERKHRRALELGWNLPARIVSMQCFSKLIGCHASGVCHPA
jgi:hypothetical protein